MNIEIRGDNVNVPGHTRRMLERRAQSAFRRLGREISEVRIVVRDLNGPRHGMDIRCSVDVRTRRGRMIRAEATDALVHRAAQSALECAAHTTRRLHARRHQFRRDTIRTADETGSGI